MIAVKKFWVMSLLLVTALTVEAQKVSVSKSQERIKGNNIDGYSTEVNGSSEEVNSSFNKYIKTFAKIKLFATPMQLSDVQINSVTYANPFYAIITDKGNKSKAWIGVNAAEWPNKEEAEKALKELEKVMYDFGVRFYREKVQVDIDEAVRAQQAAEKQQLRLQTDDKNLKTKLEFNQKEKVRLEKALVDNKTEYENLLKSIDKNKKDQDSVAIATDQIKKMVDAHKERQKKIN